MHLFEILPELKNSPIFNSVSDEYIGKYINETTAEIKQFFAKEIIYSNKCISSKVGIILSGTATVCSSVGCSNSLLRTMGRADMFGVSNLYASDVPFPSIISAKNNVRCLFIDGKAFRDFIENDKNVLIMYLSLLSGKIVYLNHKISVLNASNAEKKLAVFILDNQTNGCLEFPCSMSALADIIGVGRASLYRALDRLTDMGLITRDEKKIVISDVESIQSFLYKN